MKRPKLETIKQNAAIKEGLDAVGTTQTDRLIILQALSIDWKLVKGKIVIRLELFGLIRGKKPIQTE